MSDPARALRFRRDWTSSLQPIRFWVCSRCQTWSASEPTASAVGLIRITDEKLALRPNGTPAFNGDRKRTLGAAYCDDIYWLFGGVQDDLPENTLLNMSVATRTRVLDASLSGQGRTTVLSREHQERIIGRSTLFTVAQQEDSPKRARDSRKYLAPEGVAILGHQEGHPELAEALGLQACEKGEWISVTLVEVPETSSRRKGWHQGRWWAIAQPGDVLQPLEEFYPER